MNQPSESREELLEGALRSPQVVARLRAPDEAAGVRVVPGDDESLAQALLGAADEFYVFDLSGRIVEVNAHACQQIGYERDELVGRPVWQISTRQSAAGFERLVAALEEEGPQCLFGHNTRKDGSSYSVEARLWLAPFRGAVHAFALLRDARGHQGLIEERDQLISLIENSSEAIAVASPEGICSYMNPAGLEMLGLSRVEDVAGRSLGELHPEEQRAEIERRILPAIREGRWRGELTYRNQGGGPDTPCWVNAFAIKHSQSGELIGLAVVSHDISDRKAAERHRQRLLELNEVSRKVATSLLEGDDLSRSIEIILAGVGRILDVSRSFLCRYREDRRRVFRTHQWTAGEGIHAVEPKPESAEPYAWATDILVRGEVIRITDVRAAGMVPKADSGVLRPDVRALLVMPVVIHGRLESFFGFVDTNGPREWEDEEFSILQIIVDSFARAVERQIADRERLLIARALEKAVAREKDANRYKSEFLANMSHELRTPMNAIVGYAELLARPNVDGQKQGAWVANIRKSTDYLLSLINDVLDLSKIEAGQMSIANEWVALADTISSVEELLRGQADEKLLDFQVQYDGPVPEAIETDPVRFKQVLVNLIGNAIKYTNEGGITVRIATEESPHGGVRTLAIHVIDTGVGIEAEDLKRIFWPFSQVHRGSDYRFGGTGLGLDISRRLARLMGGEIEVESEPGKGSTFTFKLALRGAAAESLTPVSVVEDAHSAKESAGPASFVGRRILIVDDNPDNREVLKFLLAESGCAADTAENGALGVKLALEAGRSGQPYDIILMDMNMPVMDGFEATRRIVAEGVESPVLALTAVAMADDEGRCREAGCVGYVAKPVVPSAFFATILSHLRAGPTADDVPSGEKEAPVLSLVGNPRFEPLIRRYVASFPALAEALREHYEVGRMQELCTQVHRLRGTASNYGYPEISRAAGVCEDGIRAEAERAEIGRAIEVLEGLLWRVSARDGRP